MRTVCGVFSNTKIYVSCPVKWLMIKCLCVCLCVSVCVCVYVCVFVCMSVSHHNIAIIIVLILASATPCSLGLV